MSLGLSQCHVQEHAELPSPRLPHNAELQMAYSAGLQALQLGKYSTALRCFQVRHHQDSCPPCSCVDCADAWLLLFHTLLPFLWHRCGGDHSACKQQWKYLRQASF